MRDGAYPDAVDTILVDLSLYPRIHRHDHLVDFVVQVDEGEVDVPKSALLEVGQVDVVGTEAFRVVVSEEKGEKVEYCDRSEGDTK